MVAMRDIRKFARRVAEQFKPRRIILFGSYAYGRPTEDSDVDVMVVMAHRGHPAKSAGEILAQCHPGFAVDVLVRSERELKKRYEMEDWFVREIVDKGKILYEADHARVGGKGRS